jgi:hypothetical protein
MMSYTRIRTDRKHVREVYDAIAALEQTDNLNRLPADDVAEACEGPRKGGCVEGESLAAFLVTHGDTYAVCLACLALLVVEHLEQLEALEREGLA